MLIVILLATLAAEVAARHMLGSNNLPLYQADPEIEYLLKPNQNAISNRKTFDVNQYSMRAPEFPAHRSQRAERRIMLFGDSIAVGRGVAQDRIITSLLQENLSSMGRPVVVGNISASSWGPGNWLAYAKRYGFFDADTIVLITSSHDYADNPTFAPLNPRFHPTENPRSALLQYLKQKTYPLRDWIFGPPYAETAPSQDQIRTAARDLTAFLAMAKADGRKVIVFQHYETTELEGKVKPGAKLIAETCAKAGVSVISLLPVEAVNREGSYIDHIHLTEKGQEVIANAIERELATATAAANQPPSVKPTPQL